MSRFATLGLVARAATSVLLLGLGLGAAGATTMACTNSGSTYCTSGSSGDYANVSVSGIGTDSAVITIDMNTGVIADPHGPPPPQPVDGSVVFDMTGVTGATISGTGTTSPSLWGSLLQVGGDVSGVQIDAGDGTAAYGVFPFGFSCGPQSSGCGTEVVIDVTGTDLQWASIAGYSVAVDTQNTVACTGYYGSGYGNGCSDYQETVNGAIAATSANITNISTTPLPATFPLFGTALGVGGLMFRKRRQKKVAVAA